jgi:hypothetical protein
MTRSFRLPALVTLVGVCSVLLGACWWSWEESGISRAVAVMNDTDDSLTFRLETEEGEIVDLPGDPLAHGRQDTVLGGSMLVEPTTLTVDGSIAMRGVYVVRALPVRNERGPSRGGFVPM